MSITLVTPIIGSTNWGVDVNNNFTLIQNTINKTTSKAWVNFSWNGSSITIRNSYNVSSVVRNQTGDYTLTFTTPFANANYVIMSNCDNTTFGNGASSGLMGGTAPTTTTARIFTHKSSVGPFDPAYVMVTCFGDG